MKDSLLRLFIFCFALTFAVFLVACESSDTRKEGIEIDSEEEKIRVAASLESALSHHPDWKLHWVSRIGDFKSTDFKQILTDSILPMEMPEKNPIQNTDPLFPYQFVHPKGLGTMDIYSHKIEIPENLDDPYYNPDSEVIWYRADGMKERLLFMGPSGLFEEGVWINENEFFVFGFFQDEVGFRPMIWILDIQNHVVKQFQLTKTVPEYDLDSYLNQKIKLQALG